MADIVSNVAPTSLAEFEGLVGDKDVARKVFLHTIRDYMPFFDQAVIVRGNDGMGDKGKIVTRYPEGDLHGYNEGWGSDVVTGNNVRYTCSRRSSSSTIDRDQFNDQKESDRASWRLRRDQAFSRGFARATVRNLFYGDPAKDANSCKGLFNIVTPTDPVFKDRIIDAGGTTENKQTEILLVGWDPASNYLFYPQYGENLGGFQTIVHPEPVRVNVGTPDNPKHYWALETDFRWDIGVAIYDPLTVVRIANIDTTKWSKSSKTSGSPDLIDLMTQAVNLLPDEYKGRCAFYCNEAVTGILRRQINNKENVQLTTGEVAGRKVVTWDGISIHRLGTDVITNTMPVLSLG